MRRLEAITWIMTVGTDLRLSQTKTLAHLVAATLRVGRLSLATIGRQLAGDTSAKHKIKRPGVSPATAASLSAMPCAASSPTCANDAKRSP
jgi:hypothetical protein